MIPHYDWNGKFGDGRLGVHLPRPVAHRERDLLARVQDVQVSQAVAAQLRVGGRGLGRGTFLADDQLAVADVDGLVLHQMLEGQPAAM
jgi:hypothetical protein